MQKDGSVQSGEAWPMPRFNFEVSWDTNVMSFQGVSGLETETEKVEYRHGGSPVFYPIKMPGIKTQQNIIMKRGISQNNNQLWDWFNEIKMNVIERKTITIKLFDEAGKLAMEWTLNNAWPVKVSGVDLKSEGNEIAIESLEIAYEKISLSNR